MPMSDNSCRLDIPYPPVRTEGKNLRAAEILSVDLAGQVSEMSAITSYIFQHMIIDDRELSNALECISMVEMHHYELVGELIVCFGGCPRLAVQGGGNQRYWTGRFVSCQTEPASFLRVNIQNERAAINNYTAQIAQINDTGMQRVLERIILDEQHHIEIFSRFLEEYKHK